MASVAAGSSSSHLMRVTASIMGNALEFYDFTVYAAFSVMLGHAFFPAKDPSISLLLSVATFGVGFFARPLGGILIGAYADRFGRKPAMTLTIWMMAVGSGMIGVLPTYDQIGLFAPLLLVLARLVQGFSAGGEMGPATTYLLESSPKGRHCFFGSWQMASQNIGVVISGIVGLALSLSISTQAISDWGWRVPFLLGILIATRRLLYPPQPRRDVGRRGGARQRLGRAGRSPGAALAQGRAVHPADLGRDDHPVFLHLHHHLCADGTTFRARHRDGGQSDRWARGRGVRRGGRRAGRPLRTEADRHGAAPAGDGDALPGAANSSSPRTRPPCSWSPSACWRPFMPWPPLRASC